MNELYLFKVKDIWYAEGTESEILIGGDGALFGWLVKTLDLGRFLPITLKEASARFGVPYSTLAQAVREGRVEARREKGTWLVSEDAMRVALESGRLRPRRKYGQNNIDKA